MKQKNIISCKSAAKLMCQSFERKLTVKEQFLLKAHLAVCKTCIRCFRQIKCLRKVCRHYPLAISILTPPRHCCLPDESKARIKSALVAAGI